MTPTLLAGWEVEKKMVQLDEPVEDAHGNAVTERVGQVTYTADQPLPDGYRAAMELSLQLPDAAGETLVFPVVQKCDGGRDRLDRGRGRGRGRRGAGAPRSDGDHHGGTGEDEHGASLGGRRDRRGRGSDHDPDRGGRERHQRGARSRRTRAPG